MKQVRIFFLLLAIPQVLSAHPNATLPEANASLWPFAIGNKWYYTAYSNTDTSLVGMIKEVVDTLQSGCKVISITNVHHGGSRSLGKEYWVDGGGLLVTKIDTVYAGTTVYDSSCHRDSLYSYGYGSWRSFGPSKTYLFGTVYDSQLMIDHYGTHSGYVENRYISAPGLGLYFHYSRDTRTLEKVYLDSCTLIGMYGNGVAYGDISLDVAEQEPLPRIFELAQNYPNPFNPSTAIRYGLPNRSHVLLTIYNTLGQQVAVLQNGEQEAGYHEVKFDATNLSSGVYFYRLEAGSFVQTRKLLLLR